MKIILGVGGGIAAYKSAELARLLMQQGHSVQAVMTDAAQRFVTPMTFAALTGRKVLTDLFAIENAIDHIGTAQENDLLVVAPATADVLAKLAHGLAGDFLSTLYLAFPGPVLLAGMAGLIQNLVGLAGGQPLIPQMNGQAGQLAQFGGKGLGFDGLGAHLAGEVQRIPHHDARHAKPPAKPPQRAQILPPVAPPLQREHRLRRQPQLVRHSHPDVAAAYIETEIAEMSGGFQYSTPGLDLKAPRRGRNASPAVFRPIQS